jgi:putative aldouronate transport system permease protein
VRPFRAPLARGHTTGWSAVTNQAAVHKPRKQSILLRELYRNRVLFLMAFPGLLLLFAFNYLPMFGLIIAFKNLNFSKGFFRSDWYGLKNFEFFIKTPYAFTITRNTIVFNLVFIAAGSVFAVAVALALHELRNRKLAKVYQSIMFLPYFLSWVVVSYLVFSFLSVDMGFVNKRIVPLLGIAPIEWYGTVQYWPAILIFCNLWKYTGYNSVIYLASIVGILPEYFEAATIDGASKWQQIRKITIPLISPVISILVLLGIGRVFFADFGLFYQVPRNTGALFDVTNVIDTYVYRTLVISGDLGMSSAAGLYQALVGFVLVLGSNLLVRKIDPSKALF